MLMNMRNKGTNYEASEHMNKTQGMIPQSARGYSQNSQFYDP